MRASPRSGAGAGARGRARGPKGRARALPRPPGAFRQLKAMGFSDARLAVLAGKTEAEVRDLRRSLAVRPVFKRIDTCAAEFASPTPYMYSTYAAPFAGAPADEAAPPAARQGARPGVPPAAHPAAPDRGGALRGRAGRRGRPVRRPQGDDPRRRSEPHRAGHRVR